MVEVRRFQRDDFIDLMPRMWLAEKEDIIKMTDDEIFNVIQLLELHPFVSMLMDGNVIACFGVVVHGDEGNAYAWSCPAVSDCKQEFEAAMREQLYKVINDSGLRKVHCGVIKGYEHKMPWVGRLGFVKVGERNIGTPEVRFELCVRG